MSKTDPYDAGGLFRSSDEESTAMCMIISSELWPLLLGKNNLHNVETGLLCFSISSKPAISYW